MVKIVILNVDDKSLMTTATSWKNMQPDQFQAKKIFSVEEFKEVIMND